MTNKLPDRPCELVRVAVRDLVKTEADDRYRIDMANWHDSYGDGMCRVCFAGAVMAQSLGAEYDADLAPRDFDKDTLGKLLFLNDIRAGLIALALNHVGTSLPDDMLPRRDVADYDTDPAAFRCAMLTLADDLERCGL